MKSYIVPRTNSHFNHDVFFRRNKNVMIKRSAFIRIGPEFTNAYKNGLDD